MTKSRRDKASFTLHDTPFAIKQRKAIPHEFVLDAMAPLSPETRSMFGCLAVYVQDKIVFVLRDSAMGRRTMECGWPRPRSICLEWAQA
jgi:hypothetical protein